MKRHDSHTTLTSSAEKEIRSFGDFIRHERTRRKFTQIEFAQEAGISHITLGKIERGRTNAVRLHTKVIEGIAKVLLMKPETLKAFARGGTFSWEVVKICTQCWKPTTPPDRRWVQPDSHFCAKCGQKLRAACNCGQPIILEAKFCLKCGKNYDKFTV